MIIQGHLEKLSTIRSLLTHPAVSQDDINRKLVNVFAQVEYERHHYHNHWSQVIRASCQDNPAFFNDTQDKRFVDVQRFSYPPDHRASIGRCNWGGKPVFYCSSENGVPIFEVRPKINQTIVLSNWVDKRNEGPEINHPIRLDGFITGVEQLLATLPDNITNKTLKESLLNDDLFNPAIPTAIKEVDTYVGKLFSESHIEGSNLYQFTSSIAQLLMSGLDCLVYPSVESRISGYNIAIKKEIVRDRLKVYGAAMYQVVERDEQIARYVLKPKKSLFIHPVYKKPVWLNVHSKHDHERFIIDPTTPTAPFDTAELLDHEDFAD